MPTTTVPLALAHPALNATRCSLDTSAIFWAIRSRFSIRKVLTLTRVNWKFNFKKLIWIFKKKLFLPKIGYKLTEENLKALHAHIPTLLMEMDELKQVEANRLQELANKKQQQQTGWSNNRFQSYWFMNVSVRFTWVVIECADVVVVGCWMQIPEMCSPGTCGSVMQTCEHTTGLNVKYFKFVKFSKFPNSKGQFSFNWIEA